MKRKTSLVRVYESDKEILKKMNTRSIASAVNTLIHGHKDEWVEITKEYVKNYIESEVKPYIKDRMDRIEESLKGS